jgi:hypothetical protein
MKLPVDLDDWVRHCPYPRRDDCEPIDPDADLWLIPHEGRNYDSIHRHDHRRCIETEGVRAWHPEGDAVHLEPDIYRGARHPLQLRWRQPWQVAATSIVMARTSAVQAARSLETLYNLIKTPHGLANITDAELFDVGPRPVRYLRALGEAWPIEGDISPGDLADVYGAGPTIVQAYRLFTMRDSNQEWVHPWLALVALFGSYRPTGRTP